MDRNVCTKQKSLKDLLKEHGYTQKSFAKELNLAYSTVKFYVAGENLPGLAVVANMCRLLDESPKTVMKSLGIDVTDIPDDHIDDQ